MLSWAKSPHGSLQKGSSVTYPRPGTRCTDTLQSLLPKQEPSWALQPNTAGLQLKVASPQLLQIILLQLTPQSWRTRYWPPTAID